MTTVTDTVRGMTRETGGSWAADLIRGAVAGAVATWVMDLVTTGMLERQPPEVTAREEAARPNGKSALANLVDRIEQRFGLSLDERQQSTLIQVIHYGLGIVPGAVYGVLRRRLPIVGAKRGLLYGITLWAVNDEFVNSALGLAGPFGAYPVETHLRGLVGHAVLGLVTDAGIDVLGG